MPYSETTCSNALAVKWQAEALAGLRWPQRSRRPVLLSVPPQWTAWLLMAKAGMPREVIARQNRLPLDHLQRRLRAAIAMMMLPPYAARVEALMAEMPRFEAQQNATPMRAREARCAVQAG
jgi:hypothetical protein